MTDGAESPYLPTDDSALAAAVRSQVSAEIADRINTPTAPDLPSIAAQLAALQALVNSLTTTTEGASA